ncbi:MAG: carbamoyltransferase HypF [Actinomycetota bacterium]|nr:carbamoyltransferase HypF [Actinomycetota bacterium]MDQ3350617.1 carbamoyltransferase HypF [Actinomycetota bacterium]
MAVVRRRLIVRGIVQGVGFRPHVHQLADELGLAGFVTNTPDGVVVEIEGSAADVASFTDAVAERAPPLAVIESVEQHEVPATGTGTGSGPGSGRFEIQASVAGAAATLVSPDVGTCDACRADVAEAGDRRHGYAFTNCTNCGPRYSIVTTIPYDRANTTMAGFEMCAECRAEYEDVRNRRFHAQPVCCPACGPRLSATINEIAAALRDGEIVAVKGLGGYHLAVLASSEPAVARLRARKHREAKPFALMAGDLDAVNSLCVLDDAERELLASPARPIVVLCARPDGVVALSVAPGLHELGVMLPYTPLHHLLLDAVGEPIVLTSGNVADEPIAYRDDDASTRLTPIADRVLSHDRPIQIRVEDSVVRIVDGAPYPLRRSRGYAPSPISVPWDAPRPVLACGAELKSTIALARDRHVFVSHHLGDLKNHEAYRSFREAIEHVGRLFEIAPAVIAHDLHPDYLSTSYALDLAEELGVESVAVQHHHAHIVSCLADNGHEGPVIGVAFDGMGYGADGTAWGGEILVADLASFERVGHLAPVPLPGGDAATDQPWRMSASYLEILGRADTHRLDQPRWDDVVTMIRAGISCPPTTSAGRLFDAVAATIGVRDVIAYEGQAAIELEASADPTAQGRYEMTLDVTLDDTVMRGADLVAAAVDDLEAGVDRGAIAMRFHRGLAAGIAQACARVRERRGLDTVALSGGVFANTTLLTEVTRLLRAGGLDVLRHRQVPCNDGGISLGQAVAVAAMERRSISS